MQSSKEKEGEVTINSKSNNKKNKKDDLGEYVDFEEIDE